MKDTPKIIVGLVIFVGLITLPLWFNMGKASNPPKLELGTQEKQCVESKDFMKTSHMQLLDQWRDEVVRNGKREYVSTTGKKFEMSLQNTCTKCHAKKSQFCDKCHNYVDVAPKCWDCHLPPAEPQQKTAAKEK